MQNNSNDGKKTRSFGGSFWSKPATTEEDTADAPAPVQEEETQPISEQPVEEPAVTVEDAKPAESPKQAASDGQKPTTEDESVEPEPDSTGEDDIATRTTQSDEGRADKRAGEHKPKKKPEKPRPSKPDVSTTSDSAKETTKDREEEKPSTTAKEDKHDVKHALPQPRTMFQKLLPAGRKKAGNEGAAKTDGSSASSQSARKSPKASASTPTGSGAKGTGNTPQTPSAKKQTKQTSPSPSAATAVPKRKAQPAKAKPVKVKPKKPSRLDKYPAVRKAKRLYAEHRVATIVVSSLVLVLVVTYVAGSIFFSRHFLPHTTVNGNDVSLLTRDTFADRINSEVEGYKAHVTGDGVDLNISGSEVDLNLDTKTYVSAATSQIPALAWPFIIFSQHDYTVSDGVSLDESKVNQLVSSAVSKVNQNPTPTTNASFAYDSDTDDFSAIKEKLGTEINGDAAVKKVAINMQGLNPTIELGNDELTQPSVKVSDPQFKDAITEARDFPDLEIDLQLGGDTAVTLEPELIRSWLILGDNYSVTGDLDAITEYTRGTLSSKLDTVAAYRTYTRPDGKKIQINDGTYGWNIDGAKLAQAIVKRIDEKSSDAIEIPCNSTAAVYNPGGADWGNRYIDVDLTEQFARMYVGGDLVWSSECVSGGPAMGNDTVTGVFAIENKKSPEKLIGLDSNGDGEPDYENEVTFWMPFFGGYGLHDATWRYTFGGDEYLNDGSHGCVNLPYDAAESLYYEVEIGDPVIVHW